MTKPVPYARVVKSMLRVLSRTSPEVPGANPEGFVEGRFIAQLESGGLATLAIVAAVMAYYPQVRRFEIQRAKQE